MVKLVKWVLNKSGIIMYRGNPNISKVALTFDDGPHHENTIKILDILKQENIKATFFVSGKCAEDYPGIVRAAFAQGHLIANHSYEHEKKVSLIEGYKKTENIIKDITGRQSGFFRPPWGKVDLRQIGFALTKKIRIVLWSFDSADFELKKSEEVAGNISGAKINNGEIILLHDDYSHTVGALPEIISGLREKGFGFCTVEELCGSGQ
ncbi:MAG: polysaccharide deacetylase family protein [Candidatus Omnitrophica bacterium]|nr:polysaccharide deacetylase family protein [Candidatus Omnitrophota bacterium]